MKKFLTLMFVLIFAISAFFMTEVVQSGKVVASKRVRVEHKRPGKKSGKKFDPNNAIGIRANTAVLQATSTMITKGVTSDDTAVDILIDGVTCTGNSPTNYMCSSDRVTYGCKEDCACCFYEENN